MASQPCKECGARPKMVGRHRCIVCQLRNSPIDEQVAARNRRLAMVPEALHVKRVHPSALPPGQRWCAGCQSFIDEQDFGKNATQCRACVGSKAHANRIEKTYGLTAADYEALLALQGGRCAICRQRPGKKRFAVDHDHKTGAVRGLLCGTDNHDLLGAGYDSIAKLTAAAYYLTNPPATGTWQPPEGGLVAEYAFPSGRASAGASRHNIMGAGTSGRPGNPEPSESLTAPPTGNVALPVGAVRDETGRQWRVYVGPDDPPPF